MIRLVPAILLLGIIHFESRLAAAEPPGPVALVEAFQTRLVELMKEADRLSVRSRYDRLQEPILATFHVAAMARIAAGTAWETASADQRQRMVQAFTRMSGTTLASMIDGYSGEAFETVGEATGPQGTQLVDTRLVRPNAGPISLTYVTRRVEGRWYVIDVIVDRGISELSVRRSEYHRVLIDKGIDGLIAVLNAKADSLTSR